MTTDEVIEGLSQFVGEDFNHYPLLLRFKEQDNPWKQGVQWDWALKSRGKHNRSIAMTTNVL